MVSSTDVVTPDPLNPKSAPARAKGMKGVSESSDEDNSNADLLAKLESMQRTLQKQEEKIADQEQRMKDEEEDRKKSEAEMKKRLDDEKKEMKRKEQERIKELMKQEEERIKELKAKEEELKRKEEERMGELERERQLLEAREKDIGDREERISILENRSELGETDTESEMGAQSRKGRRWPKPKDVCELDRHSHKAHAWPSASAVCGLCGRSSVPDSTGTHPCDCLEKGFEHCVHYQHNECNCSYSCKFVKEYFEDSQDLTNDEMKQLSSQWSEKRRLSLVEREKRKDEEADAQKEMWRRVQEMMANEEK